MLQVINRSGPYQSLPTISDLSGMYHKMPDRSWFRQDRNIKAVVDMLASAGDDAWKSIFDAFVCEMM